VLRSSRTEASSLHRHYPASPVLQASPSPQAARPVPRGRPVAQPSQHALGLPVLRASSWCTCCRHYPGTASGFLFARSPQPYQSSPEAAPGRPVHFPFRGLLGVHSRYGLHTRDVTKVVTLYTKGFDYFVTSIAAPVASGWSTRRVGLSPTGRRRLFTAHLLSGSLADHAEGRFWPNGVGLCLSDPKRVTPRVQKHRP